MRLIDADSIPYLSEDIGHKDEIGICRKNIVQVTTKDTVDNVPTIDARPIIHAKWKRFAMSTIAFECSNCKVICQNAYSLETSKNNFNFCPNCGAQMAESEG